MVEERFKNIVKGILKERNQFMFPDALERCANRAISNITDMGFEDEDNAAEAAIAEFEDEVVNNFELSIKFKDGVTTIDRNDGSEPIKVEAGDMEEMVIEISSTLNDIVNPMPF